MTELYPLRFAPLFRDYLWGGTLLGELFGKPIPAGQTCAESWEIVDHGNDQSILTQGPLAGKSLHELVIAHGEELFGRHAPRQLFPLLFKLLDAQKTLSVQVHPNDAYAKQMNPPDLGKTEAWVVLDAAPGSVIYAGLKQGIDSHALQHAIESGMCEACLHSFEPSPGDCVFIPAGTVHALGAGLVIAEIQQASDTTFRLYDWNRVDKDGNPRPLHIRQGLEVTNFEAGPVNAVTPQQTEIEGEEILVACDYFVLARRKVSTPFTLGGGDRFHLVVVLDGNIKYPSLGSTENLSIGESLLLPASVGQIDFSPDSNVTLLDIYLP